MEKYEKCFEKVHLNIYFSKQIQHVSISIEHICIVTLAVISVPQLC